MSRRSSIPRTLAPLQRRLRAQRFVDDAMWALAIGSTGGLVATMLGGHVSGATWWTVVATATALLAFFLRRATLRRHERFDAAHVARLVERNSGLQERLSTAVEHSGHDGVLIDALHSDAEAHLEAIDLAGQARWRVQRLPTIWLITAATAWGVFTALPTPAPTPPANEVVADQPSAESLLALAAEVEADAAASLRSDLADLAADLSEHAESIASTAPNALREERLHALLDMVAQAYGESVRSEDVLERLLQRDARRVDGAAESEGAGADRATDSLLPTAALSSGRASENDVFSRFEGWIDDDDLDAQFAASGPGATGDRSRTDIATDEAGDMPSAHQQDGAAADAGRAELIGASAESQAGESLLAGRGSQSLFGDVNDTDFSEAGVDVMELVGRERDDGRRITVELPPDVGSEGYDSTEIAIGAWSPYQEAPVFFDPTPLRHREAASRYYLPRQETAQRR